MATMDPDEIMKLYMGAQSGDLPGGRVYMGTTPRKFTQSEIAMLSPQAQARLSRERVGRYLSTAEAGAEFEQWSDKTRNDFIAKSVIGGLLPAGAGQLEAVGVWEKLVAQSARYGAAGRDVSPWDILSTYVRGAGGVGEGAWQKTPDGRYEVNTSTGERRYIGPRFSTTTDTRVDFSDPGVARAVAVRMFQDMLGRDPGKGELSAFATALGEAEAANPVVATTTTEFDPTTGEALGASTTTTGGVSAEEKAALAEAQIKGKKEFGAIQAVTTYQNALENLIWGAPG